MHETYADMNTTYVVGERKPIPATTSAMQI